MILLISVVLFIVLLLMGVPIAYGMLATTLFGMSFVPNVDLITVTQKMLSGLNSFTLLAVPMFIMAANLMNIGNISQQLVDFCLALVGHIKGGMAYANVLVSMVFAGISRLLSGGYRRYRQDPDPRHGGRGLSAGDRRGHVPHHRAAGGYRLAR